jgi:carbon monoxide dehydrogenase subunit G
VKVEGTRTYSASQQTVWEVLNDPTRMAKTMPGVESVDIEDERHWKANVVIPLGLGGLRLSIDFEKSDERPIEYARLHAKGMGVGAFMDMDTEFHLSEQDGGTAMRWAADVRIAGPIGSMGQRVLQPIVNQQVQYVLNALDAQVQEAAGGEVKPAADVSRVWFSAGERGEASASAMGSAGSKEPTTEGVSPETDPELKDVGEPAESTPEGDPSSVEGTSGAEEGLNPLAPESYDAEGEGPSTSTEDTS